MQVIPSSQGGVANILAGTYESVLRRGKELLIQHWRVRQAERVERVIIAIDEDAEGHG